MTSKSSFPQQEYCPGANDLAAFVDGSLNSDARARFLEHLARCDDCSDLVADGLRLISSKEASKLGGKGRAWRPPLSKVQWLAAAGLLIGLALSIGGFLLTSASRQEKNAVKGIPVAELVSPLVDNAAVERLSGVGWDGEGWPLPRGAADRGPLDAGVSFQLGVLIVDLQIALETGQRNDASRSTQSILAALSHRRLTALEVRLYSELLKGIDDSEPQTTLCNRASSLEANLVVLAEKPYLALGKWAETIRVATLPAPNQPHSDAATSLLSVGRRHLVALRHSLPKDERPLVDEMIELLSEENGHPNTTTLRRAASVLVRQGGNL